MSTPVPAVWALPITKLQRPVRASSHSAAFFRSLPAASWAKRIVVGGDAAVGQQ